VDLTTTCYRHPDRETGVSCQRCDRYICPDCATSGAVGFLCPEDAGDRVKISRAGFQKSPLQAAPVTFALIGINVLVYIAQTIYPTLIDSLAYANIGSSTDYGSIVRVFTSGFTHSQNQITHILFNMYSLFVLGTVIEPMIGKIRFLALYFISMFAGAIGVLFMAPFGTSVVGASGAIFGLMAAYLIFLRAMKLNAGQMYIIIGINLVLGFLPGIAWEAHVGGLIAGGATAFVLAYTRRRDQKNLQFVGIGLVLVILIGLWIFGNSLVPAIFG